MVLQSGITQAGDSEFKHSFSFFWLEEPNFCSKYNFSLLEVGETSGNYCDDFLT